MTDTMLLPVKDGFGGVVYTTVDTDTYEWASKYSWKLSGSAKSRERGGGYVSRTCNKGGKSKTVFLHRQVVGEPKNKQVDHVNNNKLDNRRENLRAASIHQNMHNRRVGKGEDRGVRALPNGKFEARITVRNRRLYLGVTETKEAARALYCKAAKKYLKDFACV